MNRFSTTNRYYSSKCLPGVARILKPPLYKKITNYLSKNDSLHYFCLKIDNEFHNSIYEQNLLREFSTKYQFKYLYPKHLYSNSIIIDLESKEIALEEFINNYKDSLKLLLNEILFKIIIAKVQRSKISQRKYLKFGNKYILNIIKNMNTELH